MSQPLRVLFMGTPDFAVPVLQSLIDGPDQVVAVITNPDRPAGRGKKPKAPPVKELALQAGLPVMQPTKIKTDDFRDELAALKPDLAVVVAYGRILPQKVLDVPRLGCINVHASILPRLRGAAPINWAVIRGHARTGVSIMQMEAGLDTGPVYHIAELEIGPRETAGQLHDRLMHLGGPALQQVLARLRQGPVTPTEQDHDNSTYAPMMSREDGDLDWTLTAIELDRRVRGFSPWPGTWTTVHEAQEGRWQDMRLKIHEARPWEGELPQGCLVDPKPGQICYAADGLLLVGTGQGILEVLRCQAPGRKAMEARDFLHGCPLGAGTQLAHTT